MYKLLIRAFRAINEYETCEQYMQGHMDVLKIYGITEITTAKNEWFKNPASYVLIAQSIENQKIVGGVRVHLVGGTQPLPIVEAVCELDSSIHEFIMEHNKKGTGELCGLWNAREVAGMGISSLLMRAGISITTQFKLHSLFALCAPVTVPMVSKVGFTVEKKLGKDGTFYYPKSDLIATTVIINDVNTLEFAEPSEKEVMMNLRKNPNQKRVEVGSKGELHVEYNLIVPGI